jgi:phenylacetate-CoA ligase
VGLASVAGERVNITRFDRASVYRRMPVPAQDLMATAYGLRQLPIRHGGRYPTYVRDLDARQWWDLERLMRDQERRIERMVLWCARRVPYYRSLFAELGIDPRSIRSRADLEQLPLLDKEVVRAEPERFLPDGSSDRLVPQTTGGTTGTPLRYWATRDAVRFNYATYESRTRRWAGVRLGDRMASFHGQPIVPAEVGAGPFWRRNLAFNQLYCSVYHLNDRNLPAYVEELARFRPQVLTGYTSAIHRIAAHLLATGDIGRVRPRAVIVSSETLLPGVRDDMELAFGCRVHNAYSLGELVAYASECNAGEMHLSSEYGVVEVFDPDGGGTSEIVASGLINTGMPLLRYRTGDRADARVVAPCRCGRALPRLVGLAGRTDDVVHTPEGATVGPAPMSLAFQRVPHLRRAQVRQERVDDLTVLIEVDAEFGAGDEAFLRQELTRRLGPSLRIDVEVVETLPRTSGGKERLIVSSIARNGTDS